MRMTFLLIISFIATFFLRAEEVSYIRVAADNQSQVEQLARAGYQLADARVYSGRFNSQDRVSVKWLSENGYVTVIVNENEKARLRREGYRILSEGRHTRVSPPQSSLKAYPMQAGWPRTMSGWPTIYGQSPTIDDMNGDGELEIFLSNIEGFAYMWRPNGAFVLGFPVLPDITGWSTGSRETAAAGDINGDGRLECILGRWIGQVYAYQYTSLQIAGFPWNLGPLVSTNEAAVYDLDDDDKDEIVLVSYPYDTYAPALVNIFNDDFSQLPGWPKQLPQHSESSPAIGDIDGDGEMEIVVGSGKGDMPEESGKIYAFNLDGSNCDGYPIEVGYSVNNSPTLYDIDLDGTLDVLIRVKMESTEINGIYAFDGVGHILPGFPAELTSGSPNGTPAVADVNGDGAPEIAYGSVQAIDSGQVWLFSNDAQLMSGFPQPVYATWVEESVSLEDVSGDGLPDIVCGTNGLVGDPGQCWAFDYKGDVVSGFPIVINETFSALETTPTIIDVDGDGDTEIFTASHEGTVFAFDTPGIPAETSWPTFKHNPRRLGSIPDEVTGIAAGDEPAVPGKITLYQNYPNPFNPATRISFYLPERQAVNLRVFNALGQQTAVIINDEVYEPGRHTVNFHAGDLPSGIYYYQLEAEGHKKLQKMLLVR